jgi:acyl-CoA thioesterase-1
MELRGCLVFAGDSVTDRGRRQDPEGLGFGYVRNLSEEGFPAGMTIVNAGVGGDRLDDLANRWEKDVLAHEPDLVSVMIGINDTWRIADSGTPSEIGAFIDTYRGMLSRLSSSTRIILLEPFVLPVTAEQATWRVDLDPRIDAVHLLADEFGAVIVPTDGTLTRLAHTVGAARLAEDGVHPTPLGHSEIAAAWRRTVAAS